MMFLLNSSYLIFSFFFFNDTATTEIYTLSLHDALPIYRALEGAWDRPRRVADRPVLDRSEEHTSELQSRENLVCRLLLEKKKKIKYMLKSKEHNIYIVITISQKHNNKV